MIDEITCKSIETQLVRVAHLTKEDKTKARLAGRILGLRQSEFYKRAIIEKAQSVISSTIKENEEASSAKVGCASFLSVEKNIEGEWK